MDEIRQPTLEDGKDYFERSEGDEYVSDLAFKDGMLEYSTSCGYCCEIAWSSLTIEETRLLFIAMMKHYMAHDPEFIRQLNRSIK